MGGTIVMKIKVGTAVMCALIALAACDMNGIPNVEGTYTGPLTIEFVDVGIGAVASMRMIVEQAGANVTISGTLTYNGATTGITAIGGTVDATGFFMGTRSGFVDPDVALDTALCGRIYPATGSLTFSNGTINYSAFVRTDFCGAISYQATLTR